VKPVTKKAQKRQVYISPAFVALVALRTVA